MKKPAKSATKASSPVAYDDKRYRAEEAMRTLMRAEEIKKDKGLMSDVQKMAKEQAAKMSGLCGKSK